MPWRVGHVAGCDIVETAYMGRISALDLREATWATLLLARQTATNRFLTDCLEMEGVDSAFDLFDLAGSLTDRDLPEGTRQAIILPRSPLAEGDVRYWQIACQQRPIVMRMFSDRASALAWLEDPVPNATQSTKPVPALVPTERTSRSGSDTPPPEGQSALSRTVSP